MIYLYFWYGVKVIYILYM